MSTSPHRFAHRSQEELINAYEAEEERIVNVLSRKLEQLREDKITLENTLEQESECQVNRLNRELSLLRASQSPSRITELENLLSAAQAEISHLMTLNTSLSAENQNLLHENGMLKNMNEKYREELIELRLAGGRDVDELVGLPRQRQTNGVPVRGRGGIPIPGGVQRRPPPPLTSDSDSQTSTPLSHSPSSSSPSPFTISPLSQSLGPSSILTTQTSPPSSSVFAGFGFTPRNLTYPSVPPPSLSSSFGSPTILRNDPTLSPTDNFSLSRRSSLDHGYRRVVETGSLRRSRAGSTSVVSGLEGVEESE